ncbi:MAG: hypothetical protein ACLUFA_12430, partial [[Clostridium] leptum]
IKAWFLFHKDSDYLRHLFLHSAAPRQLTAVTLFILTYPALIKKGKIHLSLLVWRKRIKPKVTKKFPNTP